MDGRPVFVASNRLEIPLPDHAPPAGEQLVVGVRPEHVELELPSNGGGELVQVRLVEHLGHETLIVLDANGVELVALHQRRTGIGAGFPVKLSAETERLHLFSPDTGHRLDAAP